MDDFTYSIKDKDKCWYKKVCDGNRCGENFCIRHYKMSCLTYLGLLEGKNKYPIQLRLDSNRTDADAYAQLKDIQTNVNEFVSSGKNLLLFSEKTGNGKTSWATKIMLSWFDSIWASTDLECRGLFVSLPKLITAMKENITKPNEYFQYVNDNIVNADIVIWDELNHKDYTEFEHDYLLNIISQRLSLGKSNIYTANNNLSTINSKLGTRLASRVIGGSVKVELKCSDWRGVL